MLAVGHGSPRAPIKKTARASPGASVPRLLHAHRGCHWYVYALLDTPGRLVSLTPPDWTGSHLKNDADLAGGGGVEVGQQIPEQLSHRNYLIANVLHHSLQVLCLCCYYCYFIAHVFHHSLQGLCLYCLYFAHGLQGLQGCPQCQWPAAGCPSFLVKTKL